MGDRITEADGFKAAMTRIEASGQNLTDRTVPIRPLSPMTSLASGLVREVFTTSDVFDCIVSDVVMPGGDGIALAAAIRMTQPGVPILFMTGRADSKRVTGERVLHTPFKRIHPATVIYSACV